MAVVMVRNFYKYSICYILLFLATGCNSESNFPSLITNTQLEGDLGKKYFKTYGSYIHLKSGEFSKTQGKVLFYKTKKGIEIGFYYPIQNKFKLISQPVFVQNVSKVVATTLPSLSFPVYKLHGQTTSFVYVENEKIVVTKP